MASGNIQYVYDGDGNVVSAIVPIELWQKVQSEIESDHETSYLLKSDAMRRRLLEAKERQEDFPLEKARERAGL